ncbi:MAG: DUF6194 family protein [Chloroflexota bacterium]
MNEVEMSQYITDTCEGVDIVVVSDNIFFFYNPDSSVPPDHMFPFVTLMTNDVNDQFSNLDRPSVFRLNIGVGKQTFRSLFGLAESTDDTAESADNAGNYDFTTLDQIMPHPVYGRQYWVCIINPSDETLKTKVQPLLVEAYEMAVSKYDKQAARR